MNRFFAALFPIIAIALFFAASSVAQEELPASDEGIATEEGAGEGAWKEFESEEGKFEVLFPGEPHFKQSVRDTVFGDIEERHYELETPEGDFSAEYNDLPLLISLLATDRMIFRRAKDALLKEFEAEEISFGKVRQDKIKGVELVFDTKENLGRARLFMRKRRLYVLVATVSRKEGDEANILKFLDSFDLAMRRRRKPHKYKRMLEPTHKEE